MTQKTRMTKQIYYLFYGLSCLFALAANTAYAQRRTLLEPHRYKGAIATTRIAAQVTYTYQYCGGASPSQEILAQASTPQPYANQTLYFYKNRRNLTNAPCITTAKTDENGKFVVHLPRGIYAVRAHPTNYTPITNSDISGCRTWYQSPDFVLPTQQAAANYTFFIGCNPCEPPRP